MAICAFDGHQTSPGNDKDIYNVSFIGLSTDDFARTLYFRTDVFAVTISETAFQLRVLIY